MIGPGVATALIRAAVPLALVAGAVAPATAQEPPPDTATHRVLPGSFGLVAPNHTAEVVKGKHLRLAVRCIEGNVPCSGTIKITSTKPIVYERGRERRMITIAQGSVGTIPAGEGRYVRLTLTTSAQKRARLYEKTPAFWQGFWPDGTEIIDPRGPITLVSDAAR